MKLTEIFNSKAIAINYTEAASNKIPYLGTGFFPPQKKAGLDLKWIKGHRGLAVSLMPSTFRSKPTFRDRIGISVNETEMPFFREAMLVDEHDEQEIMRVQDSNDPYAIQVLENIFNDTKNLIDGANVVPERMIMQLLCPIGGDIGIDINANGVDYTYNYDPDGSWKEKHYMKIETAADKWSASATCDPLDDLETALEAQEAASETRPTIAIMSPATFKLLRKSEKIRQGVLAQVATATVNMTPKRAKAFIKDELDLDIIVYSKKFEDENGKETSFFKDNGVMLVPTGDLGSTCYGTTPEERVLSAKPESDVSIVNTGVAVAVGINANPVETETTVSEIVLPSFERIDDCYFMEVA